ncbi:hypothetical protein [Paenibacillus agilis]|uniref:Uncharacterized protein n=1 Tax=Paenibacillus agilis TaxID=3020863 RepID=A0A559J374_9BACL|nr:hypothetical protein [Paenibacillus agilis]TVX94329.1 hypothetical protein FPZ44_15480 [Paenibacillus agilis]
MDEVNISQVVYPRLTLYSEENYRGRTRILNGNLGLTNTDEVESLRFFSTSANATLVLFTRINFKGNFRIYRGSRNIPDLDDLIAGNDVESLISSNIRLTEAQVREIRRTGTLPQGFRRI